MYTFEGQKNNNLYLIVYVDSKKIMFLYSVVYIVKYIMIYIYIYVLYKIIFIYNIHINE